jgi:electron transfer flavoprotein beta subunit
MKILVTAKRVTDPDMKIEVKPDGSGIELSGINYKINPFDEIAIEEALCITEAQGGEVVIVGIGDEAVQTEIRTGLAMGAHRGILVVTEAEVDSDAVARILAKIIEAEKPDLVIMGKQAVDVDDNQVAQLLAEYLGWGQACFASKIDINEQKAVVHREVDGGTEVLEFDLPGIVSADLRLNDPRYPTLPGVMKAKKKPFEMTSPADLGVDITPKVVVKGFAAPPPRLAGRLVEDVNALVQAIRAEAGVF